MNLDLASVLAKIGRADEHAKTLKKEILRWRDSNPYMVTRQHNADFTKHFLVAHIGVEPPTVRWTLMLGDVVHNLRSALDHLVYAIAIAESGKNPPPDDDNLMFPIRATGPGFAKVEKVRLKSLRKEVKTSIEACQPYRRKHPDLPPLLLVLDELEKTDKHRLLKLTFSSTAQTNIGFVGPQMEGLHCDFWVNPGEIKNGSEICSYTFNKSAPEYKFDRFDLLLVMTVVHAKGPSGKDRTDVPSLLTLLDKEVRAVINDVCKLIWA